MRTGVLKTGQRVTVRDERKIPGGWVCIVKRYPEEKEWPHLIDEWTTPMCHVYDPNTGKQLRPLTRRG